MISQNSYFLVFKNQKIAIDISSNYVIMKSQGSGY